MKKLLKWIGIVVGGVVLVGAAGVGVLLLIANGMLTRTYAVNLPPFTAPTDAAALERGQHIVSTVCVVCHDADLGGKAVINAPDFAVINALNLTRGQGGIAADEYTTDADWVRAIRYGVDPDGKSLILMPSYEFYSLSDADLGAVIAYLKSIPPVDREEADPQLSVIARILLATGSLGKMYAAGAIDMNAPRPVAPPPGVSAAYGQYLVEIHVCAECHAADLGGGKNPDPSGPYVPNLTPGGDLAGWQETDFITALRTGVRPNGKAIDSAMPWKVFGQMTDDELKAVWTYLRTLPAVDRKSP